MNDFARAYLHWFLLRVASCAALGIAAAVLVL